MRILLPPPWSRRFCPKWCRQILLRALICAILVACFIIISTNIRADTTRYSAEPLVKLKHDGASSPTMVSRHGLYPTNVSLLDLPSFHYIINNDVCTEDTFLVIIIHSAPQHFKCRNTIRSTWGRSHVRGTAVRTVFLLGEVNNGTLQTALETENFGNRDMVQGSFLDTYRNLTYKNVMGLQWASSYCPNAEFILKMDDDIFVNIFRLAELLDVRFPKTKEKSRLGNNLACFNHRRLPVIRNPSSKWFVPKAEYFNDTYPEFCSGAAYFATPVVARSLALEAPRLPFFWVDDAHVTGTVAKSAGIGRIHVNEWYTFRTKGLVEWSKSGEDLDWEQIFAPTGEDTELMRIAHQKALSCYQIRCPCCYRPNKPKN